MVAGPIAIGQHRIRERAALNEPFNSRSNTLRRLCAGALLLSSFALRESQAQPQPTAASAVDPGPQTILAPGLYLFQTRTRDGSCNDAPRTGYVTSSVATLDGVPGSRSMTMQLLSSKYWPTWKLEVGTDNSVVGTANMLGAKDDSGGSSRFELRIKKDRLQGVGSRKYPGLANTKTTCTLNYDALLKMLD